VARRPVSAASSLLSEGAYVWDRSVAMDRLLLDIIDNKRVSPKAPSACGITT
jgi:hypothetical protein